LPCEQEYNKQRSNESYYENWDERKQYRVDNADRLHEYDKQYREENKEDLKERRKTHAERDRKTKREWQKKKRQEDPMFKLRSIVSCTIRRSLKNQGSDKNGESCWDHLPYTPEMFKEHIEAQFSLPENLDSKGQVWMNWDNHGKYNAKTWKDDDFSTQSWQIDHIKPVSDFTFTSMDDPEFQECYSLANQRPLSAKQNFYDGVRRTRHEKKRGSNKTAKTTHHSKKKDR